MQLPQSKPRPLRVKYFVSSIHSTLGERGGGRCYFGPQSCTYIFCYEFFGVFYRHGLWTQKPLFFNYDFLKVSQDTWCRQLVLAVGNRDGRERLAVDTFCIEQSSLRLRLEGIQKMVGNYAPDAVSESNKGISSRDYTIRYQGLTGMKML